MADYLTTDTELTSIANAIRAKGGTSATLAYPTEFVSAIQAIPTGAAYTFMTEEEIWTAVTSGWGTNSVMTTAQIQSAVDNGWR